MQAERIGTPIDLRTTMHSTDLSNDGVMIPLLNDLDNGTLNTCCGRFQDRRPIRTVVKRLTTDSPPGNLSRLEEFKCQPLLALAEEVQRESTAFLQRHIST
jgi:hypothetical protein